MSVACTFVIPLRGATFVIAILIAVSSCSLEQGTERTSASKDSAQRTQTSATQPTTTQLGQPAELTWSSCVDDLAAAAGLECAVLEVPVNPAKPSGPSTELALIRQTSTGSASERIGSLVINPGGPGGSGLEFLTSAAAAFPAELTDAFDLVSFDPRGVASSSPVECLDDAAAEDQLAGDLSPDNEEELKQAVADQKQFLAACQANSAELLTHMSTADVAADLDQLRIALGDEKLTYLGFSYGTAIGAVYATLYPENSRALVLDGSVSPKSTSEEEALAQAQGFENTLANFVKACNADTSCALGPDAAAEIAAVRSDLEQKPLQVGTPSGTRTLGVDLFDIGLATALYDTSLWGTAAEAIRDINTGGGQLILSLVDRQLGRKPDGSFDNSSAAQSMVSCADSTERPTVEESQQAAERIQAAAPTFGQALGWATLSCLGWPMAPNPLPEITGRGAPTVLVVGTLGDPATPYAWAEEMTAALESAVLLSYEGDGHTAFLRGGPCVDDAVVTYLVDLTVPKVGTRCPDKEQDLSFGGLRDEVISQLVEGGLPKDLAECVIDGVINETGSAEFNRMVLEEDIEKLSQLVTAQTLGCASAGD
jgi:pimeloyl-ACP methyl ester carboxylesterase